MPDWFKHFNNKFFYLTLVSMMIFFYILDNPDLSDFFIFLIYIVRVAFVTIMIYGFLILIRILNEFLGKRRYINHLSVANPKLVPYEERRMEVLIAKLKAWTLVIALVSIVLSIMFLPDLIHLGAPPSMYLLAFPVLTFCGVSFDKWFENASVKAEVLNIWFKRSVIEEELAKYFTDVTLDLERSIPGSEIMKLRLFLDMNYAEGNDLITAKRNGVEFQCCDLKIKTQKAKYNPKHNSVYYVCEDVFSGIVYKFENIAYPGRLLIVTTDFPNIAGVLTSFDKVIGTQVSDFIDTESIRFNEVFDVYTRNKKTSHRILTPLVIDNINRINAVIRKKMVFLFQGNTLYLFISSPKKDRFEMEFASGQSVEEQYNRAVKDISDMVAVLDNIPAAFDFSFE